VEYEPSFGLFPKRRTRQRVARFRHINEDRPNSHHDALELADGQTVLVTRLCESQTATVLQLPAEPHAATATKESAQEPAATPSI